MSKLFYRGLALLLLSSPAWAQYITVSGTVVDTNGCPYVNGSGRAQLVPSNVQYYFNTNNPVANTRIIFQLDSFGHFSMQLYETDLLTPTSPAPQWQFSFNSAQVVSPVAVGTINFTMQPIALTTSQDISALATAQSAPLPPGCGQPVSGGPPLNCNNGVAGANIFLIGLNPQAFGCDPLMIDSNGVMTGLQFNAISPWNGEVKVTAQGTGPPQALPANSESWVAPNVIPTSVRNVLPSQACGVAQTFQVQTQTTDSTGTLNDNWACANVSVGISLTATAPIVATPSTITGTGVISCPTCNTGSPIRGLAFTLYNPAGLTAGTTTASATYLTIPFGCTIQAYNLAIDAGTITVKFWKVATGTAIPTSGNSISTSGVSISSGTAIHSTTLSDFTTTTLAANDIMAMDITAVTSATFVNGVLQCQ